jgi:hypothetical protein
MTDERERELDRELNADGCECRISGGAGYQITCPHGNTFPKTRCGMCGNAPCTCGIGPRDFEVLPVGTARRLEKLEHELERERMRLAACVAYAYEVLRAALNSEAREAGSDTTT